MTPEEAQALKEHAEAIAAILYKQADPEELTTLAGIEVTVREQLLEHVSPDIGAFLSAQQQGPKLDESAPSKAFSGP